MPEEAQQYLERVGASFLLKPFTREQFLETVGWVIGSAKLQPAAAVLYEVKEPLVVEDVELRPGRMTGKVAGRPRAAPTVAQEQDDRRSLREHCRVIHAWPEVFP